MVWWYIFNQCFIKKKENKKKASGARAQKKHFNRTSFALLCMVLYLFGDSYENNTFQIFIKNMECKNYKTICFWW